MYLILIVPYINNVYIHLHIIAIPGKAYNFRETCTFFFVVKHTQTGQWLTSWAKKMLIFCMVLGVVYTKCIQLGQIISLESAEQTIRLTIRMVCACLLNQIGNQPILNAMDMLGNRIEPIICLMILCEFVHNNDRNHVQIRIIIALIEIRNCVYMPCVFNQMNLRTRCIQSVFCFFLSLSLI